MLRCHLAVAIYFACAYLAAAAPPAAQPSQLWLASLGAGATNRWFARDVDEPIDAAELRLGWGRPISPRLAWLVTLDAGRYQLPDRPAATSWGITPQLRYTRGRLVAEGGMGVMSNDIASPGYTYRYKWTPQAGLGVRLAATPTHEVSLSWSLVHYSHSKLSQRRNVGINLNIFRLAILLHR